MLGIPAGARRDFFGNRIGDTGSGQSSVTLTAQGRKTMITIAHVKM